MCDCAYGFGGGFFENGIRLGKGRGLVLEVGNLDGCFGSITGFCKSLVDI